MTGKTLLLRQHDHIVAGWGKTEYKGYGKDFPVGVLIWNSLDGVYRVITLDSEDQSGEIKAISGFSQYAQERMKVALRHIAVYEETGETLDGEVDVEPDYAVS